MSKLISGSDLKIKIKRRKIKINDLINKYNLNRATVSRYLNNHMAMPATFLIQVAEITGMGIEDFMDVVNIHGNHDQDENELNIEDIEDDEEESEEDVNMLMAAETQANYGVHNKERRTVLDTRPLEDYIHDLELRIEELERKFKEL